MDSGWEKELLSLSAWSREKRRIFSCGVSRSLSEWGSRSSSNLPIMSASSHSSSLKTGRAPTLLETSARERLAASSECSMRGPGGGSAGSGGGGAGAGGRGGGGRAQAEAWVVGR